MALTQDAKQLLNFGPVPGDADGFTSSAGLVMVVGSGRADANWSSLESPLAEQGNVTLVEKIITLSDVGQKVQVSRYQATFPSLSVGEIQEVGLKASDGTFLFIEALTLDGSTDVTITPDYSTETVGVEIVLHRVLSRDPVLLYQAEGVTAEFTAFRTSDGNTPFLIGSLKHDKVVYRETVDDPLVAFNGTAGVTHTVVESNGALLDTVTVLLSPDDDFYTPFPANQLKELWIGTDDTNVTGVLRIVWDEVQQRDPEMFWKIEIPIRFDISYTQGDN